MSLVALGHSKIKMFFRSLSYLHTWRILLLYCTHTLAIRFLALNKWPLRVHIMNCKQSNINSHSWQHVPIIDLTVSAYYECPMWILLGPFGTHLDVGFKINLYVWYRWLISIGSTDFYACRDKREMDLHSFWIIFVILFKYRTGMFYILLISNCSWNTMWNYERS